MKIEESTSSKLKAERFPWDSVILTPIWLIFAYVSVVFPHKTFHFFILEVPMTPLLLFFVSSLLLIADGLWIVREDFGVAFLGALAINFFVFLPVPVAWGLLSFYEVSTLPSFLAVLILPTIMLSDELTTFVKSRKADDSVPLSVRKIRGMPKPLKLIGFYASGLFFGYSTMIFVSYLFCYITNQSFEVFARANPAVILIGGATIMAGILALSRPSS